MFGEEFFSEMSGKCSALFGGHFPGRRLIFLQGNVPGNVSDGCPDSHAGLQVSTSSICDLCCPGHKFSDDLKKVLRQFSDLQQFYDNRRIHRTFTTVLRPVLIIFRPPLRRLKTTGLRFTLSSVVLRFIIRCVIRLANFMTSITFVLR